MPHENSVTRSSLPCSASEIQLSTALRQAARDRRALRTAVAAASALHLGLLFVPAPEAAAEPEREEPPRRLHMMETVRFEISDPDPEPPPRPPEPKTRKVPMPDPSPEDPEPIRAPEPEPLELPDVLPTFAPPPPPAPESKPPAGPIHMAAHVDKPVRIHVVEPRYTEIARKVRLQGVVVLQSTIDVDGNVKDVEVLKGLPMGLTESAVRAVRQWRFEPARLDGEPVAVYFTLSVHFYLQ